MPSLVANVMVKLLWICSIVDTVVHTRTIPSPSPMLIRDGTATVTTAMNFSNNHFLKLRLASYIPSLSSMVMVVILMTVTLESDVVRVTVKVSSSSSALSSIMEMLTHLVALFVDPELKASLTETPL